MEEAGRFLMERYQARSLGMSQGPKKMAADWILGSLLVLDGVEGFETYVCQGTIFAVWLCGCLDEVSSIEDAWPHACLGSYGSARK